MRIVVELKGGMVTDIYHDGDRDTTAIVLDRDVEGADADEIHPFPIKGGGGRMRDAVTRGPVALVDVGFVDAVYLTWAEWQLRERARGER